MKLLQIGKSLMLWRFWLYKAVLNTRLRYRGSKLGYLWPILSIGFVVLVLGTVWGVLLEKNNLSAYYIYILTGYIAWGAIAGGIEQGCRDFSLRNHGDLPLFTSILERASTPMFVLLLTLPWALLVTIILISPSIQTILLLPVMIFFLMLWIIGVICGLIAMISILPDVKHLVNAMMRLAFLATPIIWEVKQLGEYKSYIWYNPFYLPLESIRNVLIGQYDGLISIYFCFYAVFTLLVGSFFLSVRAKSIMSSQV